MIAVARQADSLEDWSAWSRAAWSKRETRCKAKGGPPSSPRDSCSLHAGSALQAILLSLCGSCQQANLDSTTDVFLISPTKRARVTLLLKLDRKTASKRPSIRLCKALTIRFNLLLDIHLMRIANAVKTHINSTEISVVIIAIKPLVGDQRKGDRVGEVWNCLSIKDKCSLQRGSHLLEAAMSLAGVPILFIIGFSFVFL